MLKIIGVGIGDISTMSLEAMELLAREENIILQTVEIPLAAQLEERGLSFSSLDGFYEEAEDFDDFNEKAAAFVAAQPDAALCVMGSVADSTLAAKVLETEKDAYIIPGQSFGEYARSRCAAYISPRPARMYTASQLIEEDIHVHGPVVISEVDTAYKAADIALKLMDIYPPEQTVYRVRGKELRALALEDLPREEEFDYAVSLVLDEPALMEKAGYDVQDLCDIIARLRGPGGCPWDREQTHKSLRSHLLEEGYEFIDAVDEDDPFAMEDELGDVLLQVVLHAQIGKEFSEYTMDSVADGICRKMIRRHPHVFGSADWATSDDVRKGWEEVKRQEKSQKTVSSAMEDIPAGMSALLRAAKVQKKAASVGFDWPDHKGAMEKVAEEAAEILAELEAGRDPEGECGDLLFSAVNLLRLLKVDADTALNGTTRKFIRRFSAMEKLAADQGKELNGMSLDQQDKLWEMAKKEEKICK
ncbi:MAG: nucleoside triphosphate pyrophosphohydrolase [Christensenellaceae bacterium]|nr:nucleoside triphosphate pyrophosphohydrolase [Christensenellaceae bacterium]